MTSELMPLPVYLHQNLVAVTRQGEYLVDSVGPKNFKGRLVENGVVTDKRYSVPRAGVKSTRDLTESERASEYQKLAQSLNVRLGAVVTFKAPPKNTAVGQRFVVIKDTDLSVSVVTLGGNDRGEYYRGVPKDGLDVVEL